MVGIVADTVEREMRAMQNADRLRDVRRLGRLEKGREEVGDDIIVAESDDDDWSDSILRATRRLR